MTASESVCLRSWLDSTKKKVDAAEGMNLSPLAVKALHHTLEHIRNELVRLENELLQPHH